MKTMKSINPLESIIVCRNLAERSAAMHFLAALTKFPIYSGCIEDEWKQNDFIAFPNVAVGDDDDGNLEIVTFSASYGAKANSISFSQLDRLAPKTLKPVQVKINKELKAVITQDEIKVGCQKFTWEVVDKLAAAIEEFKNQ